MEEVKIKLGKETGECYGREICHRKMSERNRQTIGGKKEGRVEPCNPVVQVV